MNTTIFAIGMLLIIAAIGGLAFKSAGSVMKRNPKIEAPFTSKKVMNRTESKLYGVLERWRKTHARDLSLSVQVSYGAFLSAENISLWRTVASKRADFIFLGRDGYVKAIIECDGDGHYGGNRKAASETNDRDQIKNDAALSANIPLIRIPQQATPAEVDVILSEALKPAIKPIIVAGTSDNVSRNPKALQ